MSVSHPSLALPEPLRAAEMPSFTNYSVMVRLPNIARRVLEENHLPPLAAARVQALIDEIPHGKVRPVSIPLAADSAQWADCIRPYEGMNWLEIPWFFAEEYFYLRVLEATGYYSDGDWQKRDPYAHQKMLGLESTRAAIRVLAEQIEYARSLPPAAWRDSLSRLLLADLWGNQNDLSMWPVKKSDQNSQLSGGAPGSSSSAEIRSAQEHVLSNDLEAVLDYLDQADPAGLRVDILLDNAGYELVADLALADFLLASGRAAQVVLHAKSHPVFVSDALINDIHATLDFLVFDGDPAALAQAIRLRSALVNCSLSLRYHPFWTSPLPAWDMPADLEAGLAGSRLLISKGDANYRRLLGDRHWPNHMPFAEVVDYFPCGVLALRTLKSEITVGVEQARVPPMDEEWMINGRWGLVQFAPPRRKK